MVGSGGRGKGAGEQGEEMREVEIAARESTRDNEGGGGQEEVLAGYKETRTAWPLKIDKAGLLLQRKVTLKGSQVTSSCNLKLHWRVKTQSSKRRRGRGDVRFRTYQAWLCRKTGSKKVCAPPCTR